MGMDVTIIIPESSHLSWPFQEADVQFLETETLSQVKQSKTWVSCIGSEGQREIVRSHVSNIMINLQDHDLM